MFEQEEPRFHDRGLPPKFLQLLQVHHSWANGIGDHLSCSRHGSLSGSEECRNDGFGAGSGSDDEEIGISRAATQPKN